MVIVVLAKAGILSVNARDTPVKPGYDTFYCEYCILN